MIDKFDGEYEFLSNFYQHPVFYDGQVWASNEHAFQAAKTDDLIEKLRIKSALTPGQAKRLGRIAPLKANWELIKVKVMYDICFKKFSQSEELKKKLLDTGDQELIEGNYWNDTFWGVCEGKGQNHLGKILMQIREELRGTDKEATNRS